MKAITSSIERYFGFLTPVIWRNVCTHILLNSCMIYTLTYAVVQAKFISTFIGDMEKRLHTYSAEFMHDLYTLTYAVVQAKFISTFIAWLWICAGYLSVTIGGHRLWSHRAFKATLPLRIFIMCIYTSTGMYSALQWARDHRVHHKYADTNADPHSSKRGLLYSHMGWLMMKRHPEHKEKGKLIDVSDVWADPVVRFQKKYFVPIVAVWFFIVPIYFFHFIMGESWTVTIFAYLLGRYCIILHLLGCINSLAHHFGSKPFNKNQQYYTGSPKQAHPEQSFRLGNVGKCWESVNLKGPNPTILANKEYDKDTRRTKYRKNNSDESGNKFQWTGTF